MYTTAIPKLLFQQTVAIWLLQLHDYPYFKECSGYQYLVEAGEVYSNAVQIQSELILQ